MHIFEEVDVILKKGLTKSVFGYEPEPSSLSEQMVIDRLHLVKVNFYSVYRNGTFQSHCLKDWNVFGII